VPASRPTAADVPHHQRVTTRWTDNDCYGHVLNAWPIAEGPLDLHLGSVVGFRVRSESGFVVVRPG